MIKSITNFFLLSIMASAYFFVLYIAYLLVYTPPYFTTEQPFKLEKKEYRIGETLTYYSTYCKYRDYIPIKVERNLVNHYSYRLPDQTTIATFPNGCRTIPVSVHLTISPNIPVNTKYHLEITIEYPINVLRTETRQFKTEEFILLPDLSIKQYE